MPPTGVQREPQRFCGPQFQIRRWSGRAVYRSYRISVPEVGTWPPGTSTRPSHSRMPKYSMQNASFSMTTQIKFGTSGWRAVMAEEFTFANVGRAVHGIARYVASQKPQGARVIVGRDPRFLGETFCSMAAEILGAHGITAVMVAEPAPTPAFAYAVVQTRADGVINFTASHNPPEYNGIKFSTPDGCPALPEVTKKIEAEIAAGDAAGSALAIKDGKPAHE